MTEHSETQQLINLQNYFFIIIIFNQKPPKQNLTYFNNVIFW